MDPMAIAAAAKAGTDVLKDVVKTGTDTIERVKDGNVRREGEKQQNQLNAFTGKVGIVIDGVNCAISAARDVSNIIISQRNAKENSSKVYSELEEKQKKVDADINKLNVTVEINLKKAQSEIDHQIRVDEQERLKKVNSHEAHLIELTKKYELAEKKINDKHEYEMEKMRLEHDINKEKVSIELLKAEKEAELTDAKIRQMDSVIENNREIVNTLLQCFKEQLKIILTMMETLELTPENLQKIEIHRTNLVNSIPKIQSLPFDTEE